jgi:lipoprotein-releasing system ATP-binding protein
MTQSASQPAPASVRTGAILRAQGVKKAYKMGEETVQVLKQIDLTIQAGEFVAIEGRSGSGKSTLLHILGALDAADEGSIQYHGQDISQMGSNERSRLRNTQFGFVFQFYHLLPELNVLENTLLGSMIQFSWLGFRAHSKELREKAKAVLAQLGLSHRLHHKPNQLSGGERQRVAIARALINNPALLLADEPTGNLDAKTGRAILDVLLNLHKARRQTILLVTHDPEVAKLADRTVHLADGRIRGSV